jgi:two-component system, cell cycle sensor histidine kinase and response regulator CckA
MRILYVEDNRQDADLARIELRRALPELKLSLAGTLVEAWILLEHPENFDVVVIDLNLPDGSGLDLVVGVRQRELPLALVMLTGLGDERSAVVALKAGVDDYLPKRGDYLRRLAGVLESAVAAFRAGLERRSRPLRVLYAEHFDVDADLTRRHLERHAGHIRLDVAGTGEEVRRRLANEPAGYDVLMLDYRLSGIDALELLREISVDGRPKPPVVLVTGQGDEAVAVEALRLGVSDYIVKRAGYLHEIPATLENAFSRAQLVRERAALRASEASSRLREEALEAMPMGVLLADAHRRILYANPAFTRLTGYRVEEVMGRTCVFLQGPETSETEIAAMSSALREERAYEGEVLNYRRDGSSFWNHVSITPVRDAAGRISNYIGVQLDVSARRSTEEALRISEERFRQIAENIHEVFWLTDPDRQKMLYISPAYESIWGRPCAEILARPSEWLKSVYPDDRDRVAAAARRQIEGDYNETYRVMRPDGSIRWVRDRAYPIRDANGHVYRIVGTAQDITETRLLEEQFLQAQKMEAIGTLAGGIAHDFNNILAAITGYTELLQQQVSGTSPQTDAYLKALAQAGARATSLVRQILTFSRPGRHERRPVELAQVVQEPLALLRATIPAMISFDVDLASDLPPVLADVTQVHQVLMNLGTNAGHAMADGPGRLSVKLDAVEVTAEQSARAGGKPRPGAHVRLTVGDTGRGMPREVMDRIFEPFFSTKAPGEGTGLGLAVVHGVMQAHDGAVTVRSKPGEGTVFELYFPAHAPQAAPSPVETEAPLPQGKGERIVLIDDEESIIQVGKLMLSQLGYRVDAGNDSAAMLEHLRDRLHEVDIVVSDVAMPGMSGPEFADHLHKLRPGLPIILMTGYDATLTQERLQKIGVREVLAKPFSVRELAAAVRRVLDQDGGRG